MYNTILVQHGCGGVGCCAVVFEKKNKDYDPKIQPCSFPFFVVLRFLFVC